MNSLEEALAAQDKALAAFRAPATEQGPELPTEEQARAYAVEMARRWLIVCKAKPAGWSVTGVHMAESLIALWGPEVTDRAYDRAKTDGRLTKADVARDMARAIHAAARGAA